MADSTPLAVTCEANGTCYCSLADVFEILSGKYALGIPSVVSAHGPVRFGGMERRLPDTSPSTISARLEALSEAGLLVRTQYDEIPPRVEYELTDEGRDVRDRLEPLLAWKRER